MSYLVTIFIIGLLIFIHELGHLLAAWAVGIPVARFSIGFGPVLYTRRAARCRVLPVVDPAGRLRVAQGRG